MILDQHVCDACGRVVKGYDKGENVSRNYIFIRGQVCIEAWNKTMGKHEWYYLRPKGVDVLVCDLDCMKDLMDKEYESHKFRMDKRIRAGEDPYQNDMRKY